MTSTTTCPFDPDDPSTITDPYPNYAILRREAPVHHLPEHGLWVVTRYADVVEVLTDPRRFSSRLGMGAQRQIRGARAVDYRIGAPGVRVLIATDPPDHTAFRGAVSASFRAPEIARLAPRVAQIARQLVANLWEEQERGGADIYRDLANPLPVLVLAELFGVPPEMQQDFRHWASIVTDDLRSPVAGVVGPPAIGRGYDMFRYFSREIRSRRKNGGDDLLGMISQAGQAGLSDYEIMAFCAFLLVAGIETTTNLLTNLVDALIRFPEVQARLWEDPSLVESAVDEALRFDTSVQALWRATTEAVVLGGVLLPAHARLLVVFGSANRDEEAFERPDTFDIDRHPNPHLAFGFGHHRCLGARLAKAELQAALVALIEATGGIEAGGEFIRRDSLVLRGLVTQPVVLRPSRPAFG